METLIAPKLHDRSKNMWAHAMNKAERLYGNYPSEMAELIMQS